MTAAADPGAAPDPFPPVQIAWVDVAEGVPRRERAWDLVRAVLREAGSPPVILSQRCAQCGGPHGPVQTTPAHWRVSVAYAAGWAIVAVAPAAAVRAIGIDAEPWDDPRREAAGWRGLLADGTRGALAWTRVEAALKADGRALRVDPALVRVREEDAGWIATIPGGAAPVRGIDVVGPDGVAVSVAALAPEAAATAAGRATP